MNLGNIFTVCRSYVVENNAIAILFGEACYEHLNEKMFLVQHVKKYIRIFLSNRYSVNYLSMYINLLNSMSLRTWTPRAELPCQNAHLAHPELP